MTSVCGAGAETVVEGAGAGRVVEVAGPGKSVGSSVRVASKVVVEGASVAELGTVEPDGESSPPQAVASITSAKLMAPPLSHGGLLDMKPSLTRGSTMIESMGDDYDRSTAAGSALKSRVDIEACRREFRRLFDIWDEETEFFSSPHQMYGHWAYRQIIELGEPAIPYMLGEMQRGLQPLGFALRAVSGETPIRDSGATTAEKAAAWIAWGKEKGHDPTVA